MRVRTSAKHAWGSAALSFAVWIGVAIAAVRLAPRSELAKSHDKNHDVRGSATSRGARSAAFFLKQIRLSSMKRAKRSQR